MRINNQDIISTYKIEHNMPKETPLYTYAVWYSKGYKSKPKEVCKHRITLWKHGKMSYYKKELSLFEREQVEKILK